MKHTSATITITVILRSPFNEWFASQKNILEVPKGSTIAETVETLIKRENMHKILKAKRAYNMDELKALYAVNESIEKREFVLQEGDVLKIFGVFMGG